MFFTIIGPIASGKRTIANYLKSNYNFTEIYLQYDNNEEIINFTTDNIINNNKHISPFGKEIINSNDAIVFNNSQKLLDFVTINWTKNYVLFSECIVPDVLLFKKRPTFLLISVNAPIIKRYKRYQLNANNLNVDPKDILSFEDFCKLDDTQMFERGLNSLMNKSDLKIENVSETINEFHDILNKEKLTDYERLRPSWDTYFMTLSFLTARRSNCMKRKVGCILTKNHYIISTGYNGTPRNIKNCYENGCERCNSNASMGTQLDMCLCLHAEENALLEAGRDKAKGATLYCNTCPCIGCTIKIIQVGVEEVVYALEYRHDEMIKKLFKEAGVSIRKYNKVDYNYLFNF
ncbi:putative deoxycytidylate deaminase [Anaeromyces robustus]|uniref:Deoxycytidylate deaminase n=1 Tax=Anaeromyces robustus TaxID=1754192 RepID=A0A1Y1XKC4_9FUNG|nr:putative deoxycytidylate deaminase [Anaeromyces robustus]|eukprot:ORX86209.1 putative deoxycytidylate deaminase [Anaeromyces robustus]